MIADITICIFLLGCPAPFGFFLVLWSRYH